MACTIRDGEGRVVGMTTDNNKRSNLFDELNRKTPEIAEDAYAISKSTEFKEQVTKPKISNHIAKFKVDMVDKNSEVKRSKENINTNESTLESELNKVKQIASNQAKALSRVINKVKNRIAGRLGIDVETYNRNNQLRAVNNLKKAVTSITSNMMNGLSSENPFTDFFGVEEFSEVEALFQSSVEKSYVSQYGLSETDYIMSSVLKMEDSFGALDFPGKLRGLSNKEAMIEEIERRLQDILERARNTNDFYIQDFSEGWLRSAIGRVQTEAQKEEYQAILDGDSHAKEQYLEAFQEEQRSNLLSSLEYLIPSKDYSPEFKYLMTGLVIRGAVAKDVTITHTNKDGKTSTKVVKGIKVKRSNKTTANHQELSSMVLPSVYEEMINGRESNPMTLIDKYNDKSYITKEEASDIVRNRVHERTKDGMWIRFEKSDNSADAVALTKLSKLVEKTGMKNPWCTGGGMATTYLPRGDFYLFVDNEYNPQITVRYEGDKIAEIRGTKDSQELTKTQNAIVGEFLPNIPNGKDHISQIKATNTLYLMREGRDFQTKEELVDYFDTLTVDIETYNRRTVSEHEVLKYKYLDRAIAANDKFKIVNRIIRSVNEDTVISPGDLVIPNSSIRQINLPENGKIEGVKFLGNIRFVIGSNFKYSIGKNNEFNGGVDFEVTTLPEGFKIESNTTFNGYVNFKGTTLPKRFKIESGVTFVENVYFNGATLPEGFKIESGTTFNGDVIFRGATLPEGFKIESGTTFNGDVIFRGATLPEGFKIESNTTFNGYVDFEGATLPEGFKIESGTTFNGDVNFEGATLPEGFKIEDKDNYTVEITYPNGEVIEYKKNQSYIELNQDNRGAIIKTSTKTLTLLDKNNADVTTPIHELAHEYERGLTNEEIKVIEDWSGHRHGTTEFSEAFAKGAELYIFEGTTFEGKVDNIFQKLYEWFKNVIKDAIEYFGDINQLNDAIRDVYDKMFMDGNIETGPQQTNNTVNEIVNQLRKTGLASQIHQLSTEQIDQKLKELGVSEEVRKKVIAWRGRVSEDSFTLDKYRDYGELLSGFYFGEKSVAISFANINPFGVAIPNSKVLKARIDDSTFPTIDMRRQTPTNDADFQKFVTKEEYEKLLEGRKNGTIKGLRLINAPEHLYNESRNPTQYVIFDRSVVEELRVYEKEALKEIIEPLFQKGITLTTNGFVYNNEVYLNTDNLNPETPIHEFAHLYNTFLKQNRPELYSRGIELVSAELNSNNSDIKSVIDYVKATQPNLKGESLSEEILAQLIGEKGVELINRNKKGGIVEWIKNVWEEIRNLLGLSSLSIDQVANLTVQDFAEMAAADLLRGERLTSEIESIKEKAIADGTFMKAPNGENTNLNEAQWVDVRTKRFKEWFGDWINDPQNASKVVDSNGEPLVVYHSTNETFTEYDVNRRQAVGMFSSTEKSFSKIFGKNIMEIFLNIRNPKDLTNFDLGDTIKSAKKASSILGIEQDFLPTPEFKEANLWEYLDEDTRGIYEAEGFDGILTFEDGNEVQVTFNPNQIKSATDNVGTFSAQSADIRYQVTGEQGARNLDQVSKAFNEGVEAVDTSRNTQLTVVTDLSGNQTEVDSSSIITYETEVGPIHYIIDSNGDMEMVRLGEQAVPEVADSNYKLSTNVVEVNGYRTIQLLRGDELLGYIRTQPFEDGVEIERSLLTEGTQRGQGIGTKMYKLAIQDAIERGLPIYSDHSQTAAAKGVWNKLVEEGLAEFDTNTERFKVSPLPKSLDNNGEPSAKDVYEYINRKNSEEVQVTPEDRINIIKSLVGFQNTDEMLSVLKDAFMREGYFNPTKQSLMDNGYTQAEAENIIRNPEIQQKIADTIEKIEALPESIEVGTDTLGEIDFLTLETNAIGKMKNENPFKVKQQLVEELGGIKDETFYNDKINEEGLEIAKGMFDEFSQYNEIEVLEFNEEGELTNKPKNNTYEVLSEVMTEDDGSVRKSIDGLLIYDDVVLETERELAEVIIDDIIKKSVEVGVDLMGMKDISDTVPMSETKMFLFGLLQTLNGEMSIQEFSESYNEYFGIDSEVIKTEKHLNIPENSVIIRDKNKTAYDMFVEHGLLYMGDKVYKRVNNRMSLDTLYEAMFTSPEVFPQRIFEGVKMNDEVRVREAITNYVYEQTSKIEAENMEMAEEYILNNIFFNSTLNHEVVAKEVPQIGNTEYLTTTFIADFYKEVLRNKLRGNEKYNDFYSNFNITKNGIEYISKDPISMAISKEYMSENLKNYFSIKKDFVSEDLVGFSEESEMVDRNVYMNFPQIVKKLNRPYEVKDANTIIVENTNQPFIRVSEGLYEMIDSNGNQTFYTKLPVNNSPYIQTMNVTLNDTSAIEYSKEAVEVELEIKPKFNKLNAKENLECS